MKSSSDPLFQTAPQDRREWWALLRRLVGWVYDIELPEVQCPPEELARVAAELAGKPLPPAVVEWMAFTHGLHKAPPIVDDGYYGHSFRIEVDPANEALVINCWRECAQWAIHYSDLEQNDPPVNAYDYVQSRKGFVHRKSYGQAPLTHYALHAALNYSPGLDGWIDWGTMGCGLDNPRAFLEELRATKGAVVSPPYGSLTFVEGEGWLAWIIDGWTPWGRNKGGLYLRTQSGLRAKNIPKPIRDKVELRWRVMP
jgi:hypothetical protein